MMEIKEAIKIIDEVIPPPGHYTVDLDHFPIAQAWECVKSCMPEPVRHGKWYIDGDSDVRCSMCQAKCLRDDVGINITSLFCPSCGARMDGGENIFDELIEQQILLTV